MDTLCLMQLTAWTSMNAEQEIRVRNCHKPFASMRSGITGNIFVWFCGRRWTIDYNFFREKIMKSWILAKIVSTHFCPHADNFINMCFLAVVYADTVKKSLAWKDTTDKPRWQSLNIEIINPTLTNQYQPDYEIFKDTHAQGLALFRELLISNTFTFCSELDICQSQNFPFFWWSKPKPTRYYYTTVANVPVDFNRMVQAAWTLTNAWMELTTVHRCLHLVWTSPALSYALASWTTQGSRVEASNTDKIKRINLIFDVNLKVLKECLHIFTSSIMNIEKDKL